MCEKDDCPEHNDPVTEALCQARREVLIEKIEGLKKAVYISAASITVIVTVVQLILALLPR